MAATEVGGVSPAWFPNSNAAFDECGCDRRRNEGWRSNGRSGCAVGSTTSNDERKCCLLSGCSLATPSSGGVKRCLDCGHGRDIDQCQSSCTASTSSCMAPATGFYCNQYPCTKTANCNNGANVERAEWDSNYCQCTCKFQWETDFFQNSNHANYQYCSVCDDKYEQTQCKSCAADKQDNYPDCDDLDCPVTTVTGASSTCTPSFLGVDCLWTPSTGYTCDKTTTSCTLFGWDFPNGPTCSPDCHVEEVIGATLTASCTAGSWKNNNDVCTYTVNPGYSCVSNANLPGSTFDLTCSGGQPIGGSHCEMHCDIPVIEGVTSGGMQAADCVEGQQLKSGSSCFWVEDPSYSCTNSGMQQCNDGMMVIPSCARPCDVTIDPGVEGSGDTGCDVDGKVSSGTQCTFTAKPSFTCNNLGARGCNDGTWGTPIPTCIAGCTVNAFTAATSTCVVGTKINNGQTCTWTENSGYSCSNTGVPISCTNGQWDATIDCFSDCTLRTVLGSSVQGTGCSGPVIKNGTSCTWVADPTYTCTDMITAVCRDGNFKDGPRTIAPSCLRPCEVLPIIGASSSCVLRSNIASSQQCRWTADDGYQCDNRVTNSTCTDGAWDKQPSCQPNCFIPLVDGAVVSGTGCAMNSSVSPGTTCTWAEATGYNCTNLGQATCTNGRLRSPSCASSCSLAVVDGASVTGTGCVEGSIVVPVGSVCTWAQDAGSTCTGLSTSTCAGGSFADPPPVCTSNCPVTTPLGARIVSGSPCDGVSSVASGTQCDWQATSGFTCTQLSSTCTLGLVVIPTCVQQCSVSPITGITSSCNGLVDDQTTCTWTAEPGFSCTHADSVCQGGMLVPAAPISCERHCTVPTIPGATVSTNCVGQVPHGEVCIWTPYPVCINAQPTSCIDGSWNISFSCTDDCNVPVIDGATSTCMEGTSITHGTTCVWSQDQFYTCNNIGSFVCTRGVLPPNPQCNYTACAISTIVGAEISNPTVCTGPVVEEGISCEWIATSGFSCKDATTRAPLPAGGYTCQNGAFSGNPSCSHQCQPPNITGAHPTPGSSCDSGLPQDDGVQCNYAPKPGYTCPALSSPLMCSNSQFTVAECFKDCPPSALQGLQGNCSSIIVEHGEWCSWTAAPQYTCTTGSISICNDGVHSSIPTCAHSCTIPSTIGINYTATACGAVGTSISNGTRCDVVPITGFSCTGIQQPVFCSNGEFVYSDSSKTNIKCQPLCPVQSIIGATSNCSSVADVQAGEYCQWSSEPGYTCTGLGNFMCESGTLTGMNISCSSNCVAQDYLGTVLSPPCVAGGSVSIGDSCRWVTQTGYSCIDGADADILCTSSSDFEKQPECHADCLVPDVIGATTNCSSATVQTREWCMWTQDNGYTCTGLGGQRCHNGLLPSPTCTKNCPILTVVGADETGGTCDGSPGSSCTFTAKNSYTCVGGSTVTCNGGIYGTPPVCTKSCDIPTVSGATSNCTTQVPHGNVCNWSTNSGFSCTDLNNHVCEHGYFTALPTCHSDCVVPLSAEATAKNCSGTVPEGESCEWDATFGYICDEVTTCINGALRIPSCTIQPICNVTHAPYGAVLDNCVINNLILDGDTCDTTPMDGHTCDFSVMTCDQGRMSFPRCTKDCFTTVEGNDYDLVNCTFGTNITDGVVCEARAKANATCVSLVNTCDNGTLPQPNCKTSCSVPSATAEGVSSYNCSGSVPHKTICTAEAEVGYVCEFATQDCIDGQLQEPICTKSCDVRLVSSGVKDYNCSDFVSNETICNGQSKEGYECDLLTSQCISGNIDLPTCTRLCEIQTPPVGLSSYNCTGSIKHDTICMGEQDDGFTCTDLLGTCIDGSIAQPTCIQDNIPCNTDNSIGMMAGIKDTDCDNVTLASGESCISLAMDDFICTGLNSTCEMGNLSKPICNPIIKNPCTIGNISGVTSNCTNQVVMHGDYCAFEQIFDFTCKTVPSNAMCDNGTLSQIPECKKSCDTTVYGALCKENPNAKIDHNMKCTWELSNTYKCSKLPSESTCVDGVLEKPTNCYVTTEKLMGHGKRTVAESGANVVATTVARSPLGAMTATVLSAVDCKNEEVDLDESKLDPEFHPIRAGIGNGKQKYFVGAVVYNTLIILGFAVFQFICVLILQCTNKMSYKEGRAMMKAPGLCVIPFLCLLQGTSLSASNMAIYPENIGMRFLGIIVAIVYVVLTPAGIFYFILRKKKFKATTIPDPRLEEKAGDSALMGWKRKLYIFCFGTRIWISKVENAPMEIDAFDDELGPSKASSAYAGWFVERFGPIFETYKDGKQYWALTEIFCILSLSLIAAWHPRSDASCHTRNVLISLLFFLLLVFVSYQRPFMSALDNLVGILMAFLMFGGILCMSIGFAANKDPSLYEAAGRLLNGALMLLICKAVYDLFLYAYDIYVGRRKKVRDNVREHGMIDEETLSNDVDGVHIKAPLLLNGDSADLLELEMSERAVSEISSVNTSDVSFLVDRGFGADSDSIARESKSLYGKDWKNIVSQPEATLFRELSGSNSGGYKGIQRVRDSSNQNIHSLSSSRSLLSTSSNIRKGRSRKLTQI